MGKNLFEQFEAHFNDVFGSGANSLSKELREHLKGAMMRALERLNVVTQDEFDTQNAVLKRSRQKIDQLEKQVSAIEKSVSAEKQ
ncbi:MAG: hypothetical protein CMK30_02605 [Porticoccaceae bacterium]|nr:hypothetical protein [Porticoccaceae bacterium]|tara:strand:- start:379 stop:633 length:255 start_codon:yes stop_codon:yes gene_type:complete